MADTFMESNIFEFFLHQLCSNMINLCDRTFEIFRFSLYKPDLNNIVRYSLRTLEILGKRIRLLAIYFCLNFSLMIVDVYLQSIN